MKTKKMTLNEFKTYVQNKVKKQLHENEMHNYRYLTMEKDVNGLTIGLNSLGKDEVRENIEARKPYDYIWGELFDDVQGNSEYIFHPDMGDAGFGLTNAPGITDGYHYVGEEGSLYDTDYPDSAEVYWFPDYMIADPLDELHEKGKVFFTKA